MFTLHFIALVKGDKPFNLTIIDVAKLIDWFVGNKVELIGLLRPQICFRKVDFSTPFSDEIVTSSDNFNIDSHKNNE